LEKNLTRAKIENLNGAKHFCQIIQNASPTNVVLHTSYAIGNQWAQSQQLHMGNQFLWNSYNKQQFIPMIGLPYGSPQMEKQS